jgi:serine/threonine-protein kinase
VIDFGVAKALGQELTDKTLVTGFAQIIGTPLYMSPEQAGQSGLDMDTRSDIYSLGVLLYELLTGTTPFEKERFRTASYEEIRRIIQEEDPPRPSTRISTLGQVASAMALKRQSDPKRLRRLVRGELDWIVMKCLEKDRSWRYETANGLAMDVQRYLHDEPVLACPPSAWYRYRKFARRNKAPLVVVSLILFCIALVGVGGGWMMRDRMVRDEALDRQVNYSLDEGETHIQSAKWLEAAAAVERAYKLLTAAGRQDGPARLAELQNELTIASLIEDVYSHPKTEDFLWGREQDAEYARTFATAGIDLTALPVAEAAEQIQRWRIRRELVRALDLWSFMRHRIQVLGGGTISKPDWKQLTEIASAADPDPLRHQLRQARLRGDRKALETLAATADIQQLPPESLLQLMTALYESGGKDEAMAFARRAVIVHQGDFWLNDYLAFWSGTAQPPQWDDTVRYYTAARSIRPNNPYIAKALGYALLQKKVYTEAVATLSWAIELKPDNWDAWQRRGETYLELGKKDEALSDFTKALGLDPNRMRALINRSKAHVRFHEYEKALADATKATELDPKDGWAWFNRGLAHICLEKYDEAVSDFSKALERDAKHADSWYQRGFSYYWLCQYEKAISDYSKAIELQPSNVWAWLGRGNSYYWSRQYDQAIANASKAVELDPKFVNGLNILAWYLTNCSNLKIRDPHRAIELAKKAVELAHERGINWNTLGVAQYRAGDWVAALKTLDKSREYQNGGDAYDFFFLAMASWQLGKKTEALKWYKQAVQWVEENDEMLARNPRTTEELRSFRAEAAELLKGETKKE